MNKVLIKSIVVLVAICLVISAALAVVNSFTAPVIEAAAIQRETESRQQLLPDAVSFEELAKDSLPASIQSAFAGIGADGQPMGYVFTAGNQGFNGTIVVMAAIGTDGKIVRVNTMDVTSETATLGGLTAKEASFPMYWEV